MPNSDRGEGVGNASPTPSESPRRRAAFRGLRGNVIQARAKYATTRRVMAGERVLFHRQRAINVTASP